MLILSPYFLISTSFPSHLTFIILPLRVLYSLPPSPTSSLALEFPKMGIPYYHPSFYPRDGAQDLYLNS